jgi:hypothetical protein
MTHFFADLVRPWLLGASLALAALPASADSAAPSAEASAAESAPAAPAFEGWVIKQDNVIARKQITSIESKLGGKIKALRNTTYDVKGKTIQVNVISAASAADADAIYRSLTQAKADWSVVRKGALLYEFVGKNDVMDDIKAARARLASP